MIATEASLVRVPGKNFKEGFACNQLIEGYNQLLLAAESTVIHCQTVIGEEDGIYEVKLSIAIVLYSQTFTKLKQGTNCEFGGVALDCFFQLALSYAF